jgi:hypothetical protein
LNELRGGGYALLKRVSAVFAKNQLWSMLSKITCAVCELLP